MDAMIVGRHVLVICGQPAPLSLSLAGMTDMPGATLTQLKMWQQNIHKSRMAQEDLINLDMHKEYDLLGAMLGVSALQLEVGI